MIGVISEDENHNKIFKPMAGATLGQGVPLGTWCSFEKDVAPSNNWLMAGTTFDASVYPALNLYLGTNKVPYRYDHDRPSEWEDFYVFNNNSYIMSSAPYDGKFNVQSYGSGASRDIEILINDVQIAYQYTSNGDLHVGEISFKYGDKVVVSTGFSGSIKKAWVSFYKHPLFIKATSIASDSDQQAILAQIQAYNTYSTEETLTGKTWIDGKPIYRVVRHTVINSQLAQGYTTSNSIMTGAFTTNAETVVDIYALSYTTAGGWSKLYTTGGGGARAIAWRTDSTIYNNASDTIPNEQYIILEYTKTTD